MYSFYLGEMLLPVAPAKLTLQTKNFNKTLELMNLGEINVLKKAGLTDISFEALLPGQKYPFAEYEEGFEEPSFYLEEIEKLKLDTKPFRFIVSRFSPEGKFLFDTDMEVSLEEYSIVESAEEGLDITVAIKLKQYERYATQKLQVLATEVNTTKVKVETPRPAKEPAKTYTVKAGDSLWAICKKELGNGSKYSAIATANSIKNPNSIYPGQVLNLG